MRRLFLVDLGAFSLIFPFLVLEISAVCRGDSLSAWGGPIRLEEDEGSGLSVAIAEVSGLFEVEIGALRDDFSLLRILLEDVLRVEAEEVASTLPDAAAARLAARALLNLSMPSSARRLIFSCSSL
jgi:hypothetical protein